MQILSHSVTDITRIPRGTPDKIDAYLLGDVGENVRQFLRTTWHGEDVHVNEVGVQAGLDLIEDFAMRAAALRDNQECAEHGQDITSRTLLWGED